MEKRIRERYSDAVLREAMQRYGVAGGQIRLLDGFESFIYEFEREGVACILRIGHSLRRSEGLIQGEVDWVNYLARGGVSVAQAVRSENGRLVEQFEDGEGECFLATAFVKAQGKPPGKAEWNAELFERYGELLGRMHALTKEYEPADPSWRRPEWDDVAMLEVEGFLPPGEERVVERFQALMEHLEILPRGDSRLYGLIHQDAHAGNLHVDEDGRITLFDFDDCAYSWFMNDIAIVLFYAVMWEEDGAAFTEEFMKHFLRGYGRENEIDAGWLGEIPHFLKLREIDLYAVIHRSFDVENLEDAWCARYMENRKGRIEAGIPYVDYDFDRLARYVCV